LWLHSIETVDLDKTTDEILPAWCDFISESLTRDTGRWRRAMLRAVFCGGDIRVPTATLVLGVSLRDGLRLGHSRHLSSTLTIKNDSQHVGNVTCSVTGAPCIAFGASGISLKLNGFSITAQADLSQVAMAVKLAGNMELTLRACAKR
jgi:hypothetical protein